MMQATPRAVNAQLALATRPKVPRHAMVFLLVRTVGMVHFEHAKRVIFAKVKPPIKPLAYPDPTPPKQDPLHALNAHLECMPTLLVPYLVKIVTLIPINRNPMLRNVYKCKKGTTNPVQQPKSNAQRVKQEVEAMQRVVTV
jgi:hypothetical protein